MLRNSLLLMLWTAPSPGRECHEWRNQHRPAQATKLPRVDLQYAEGLVLTASSTKRTCSCLGRCPLLGGRAEVARSPREVAFDPDAALPMAPNWRTSGLFTDRSRLSESGRTDPIGSIPALTIAPPAVACRAERWYSRWLPP
jgi:hypothetical protein